MLKSASLSRGDLCHINVSTLPPFVLIDGLILLQVTYLISQSPYMFQSTLSLKAKVPLCQEV